MVTLTENQRNVLAHVVLDPDAWLSHAVETFGEERAQDALEAKVERHQESYDLAVAEPDYQPRAQREAE